MTQEAYEAMYADVVRALQGNGSLTAPANTSGEPGASQYLNLFNDLAVVLHTPSGIREILGPEHDFHGLTDDVAASIDTSAGLQVILGREVDPLVPVSAWVDDLQRIRNAAELDRLLPRFGGWHTHLSAAQRYLHDLRANLAATEVVGSEVSAERLATAPARLAIQDVEVSKVTALLAASLPHRRIQGTSAFTERRQTVSVLFVDIVGFATMADNLNAAEVRSLQRDYFAIVTRTIRSHGGHIEKYVGDAVLAVFGLQPSPDNGAGQAVTAALQLQAAVPQVSLGGQWKVRIRVGVATGDAIVDTTTGTFGMISGSVVSVAARIQAHAKPGSVLVSQATHHATMSSVRYADEPQLLTLPGSDHPLEMWHAVDTLVVGPAGREWDRHETDQGKSEPSSMDRQYVSELCQALIDVNEELRQIVLAVTDSEPINFGLRRRSLLAADAVATRVEGLWCALSDFRGADLENIGLAPADLEVLDGVYWSNDAAAGGATRWPEPVRSQIGRLSLPFPSLGPGVFVVSSGTAIALAR